MKYKVRKSLWDSVKVVPHFTGKKWTMKAVLKKPQYLAKAKVKGNKYIRHSIRYATKSC